MNRVQRIMAKYNQEHITFGLIANGCIELMIDLRNGYKRIVPLSDEESDEYLHSTIVLL